MTKSEFDKIDHSIIWLWQVEKEMRDIERSYRNVWSDYTRRDAYRIQRLETLQEVMSMWNDARYEHLACLADEMREKGVKFLKI